MRKFTADYLFTGREMAEKGSVLVTKDDGTVDTILPAAAVGEGVEVVSGLLTPGFINCHCHLELSHMKGLLPEKTGMVDFLLAVIRGRGTPSEKDLDIIRDAIARGEESMLHNGIVAVGDICNTNYTLQQKGEGRMYYHNFIETMGFIEHTAHDRYKAALSLFQDFAGAYTLPIAANSLVPHAPYSVSSRLFQLIANFPGNQLITIHNQESLAENQFYQTGQGDFRRLYKALGLDISFFAGTGKRSLSGYLPHFHRNQTLLLVHNVDTREEDLDWLRHQGDHGGVREEDLRWCLCPNANLYIGGQLPDVDLLLRHNCRIVLGTDSLASNYQLDILEEMKTLQRHFGHLSTATLLQWATYNGAETLQLEGVLGEFAPGKQPGVVLVEGIEGGRFTDASRAQRLI
jgi:cytosine/adenosine deaminase-related metal-dependent hydrolase